MFLIVLQPVSYQSNIAYLILTNNYFKIKVDFEKYKCFKIWRKFNCRRKKN